MADQPLWLTEADVVDLMNLPQAIDALEQGLVLAAEGGAQNMGKTHASWDAGASTLHAVGATFEGMGYVGAKAWAHTPGGATPLVLVWHAESGDLAAIIEAFALGQMRTGGISGLATRWMSREDSRTMAIVGTGKQALAQVAAVAAVRTLTNVRVFSPTPSKRAAFAEKLHAQGFGENVLVCSSAKEALDGADIVTVATRAREPFIETEWLAEGAHINAIGAITPERAELSQSVFVRASLIVADDPGASRRLSSEFRTYFGDDDRAWEAVRPLSAVVAERAARAAGSDLSIFKAMGMGISDLALAIPLFNTAREHNRGRTFEKPIRVAPRLRA